MSNRIEFIIKTNKHTRARGRNGYFVPKEMVVERKTYDDGSKMLRIMALSQRPSFDEPPLWLEVPLSEWIKYAREVAGLVFNDPGEASA